MPKQHKSIILPLEVILALSCSSYHNSIDASTQNSNRSRRELELNWTEKPKISKYLAKIRQGRGSRATATAKRSYNMRKRRRYNKNKKQASTKQNKIKQSIAYQASNNDDEDDAGDDDDDVVAGLLLRLGTGDNLLLLLDMLLLLLLLLSKMHLWPFFDFGQREMAAWTNFHFHWLAQDFSRCFGQQECSMCSACGCCCCT